jgi:Raf kinase inhibitor-like YbhB/YbcL family protein
VPRPGQRLLILMLLIGVAWGAEGEQPEAGMRISSPAFAPNGEIPRRHTCGGADVSPALAWAGVPPGTRSLALIVDDPDAPDPSHPKTTWVHWVLYDLPPDATGLAEGVGASALPPGTREGRNDWKATGYRGPCPPVGRHRYFFKLFALGEVLPDLGHPGAAQLLERMQGHVLERAELVGTFQR